jgi:hypothetical protein
MSTPTAKLFDHCNINEDIPWLLSQGMCTVGID